jgi:hypothetical protein
LIAKLVVKKIVTECVQISIKNKIKDFPGTFTEKWVNQDQFSDPDFISGKHQRENVQFANKQYYQHIQH